MWRDTASPPGPVHREGTAGGPQPAGHHADLQAERSEGRERGQGPRRQLALPDSIGSLNFPGASPFPAWLFSFTQRLTLQRADTCQPSSLQPRHAIALGQGQPRGHPGAPSHPVGQEETALWEQTSPAAKVCPPLRLRLGVLGGARDTSPARTRARGGGQAGGVRACRQHGLVHSAWAGAASRGRPDTRQGGVPGDGARGRAPARTGPEAAGHLINRLRE